MEGARSSPTTPRAGIYRLSRRLSGQSRAPTSRPLGGPRRVNHIFTWPPPLQSPPPRARLTIPAYRLHPRRQCRAPVPRRPSRDLHRRRANGTKPKFLTGRPGSHVNRKREIRQRAVEISRSLKTKSNCRLVNLCNTHAVLLCDGRNRFKIQTVLFFIFSAHRSYLRDHAYNTQKWCSHNMM